MSSKGEVKARQTLGGGTGRWSRLMTDELKERARPLLILQAHQRNVTRNIPCSDQRLLRRTAAISRQPQILPLSPGY